MCDSAVLYGICKICGRKYIIRTDFNTYSICYSKCPNCDFSDYKTKKEDFDKYYEQCKKMGIV